MRRVWLIGSAWNIEGLHTPTKPYTLLDFDDESAVASCRTMADRAVGGYSTANLDYVPADPSTSTPAHARFHGSISTKLPPNWRIQRTGMSDLNVAANLALKWVGIWQCLQTTGYAAFRNKDRGFWLFGRLYWDIDPYTYLALRVRSDGRRYTVNIQTDSIVETDIHQHRLYTRHHRVLPSQTGTDSRPVVETAESLDDLYPSGIPPALSYIPPESTIISSATTSGAMGWETVLLPFHAFVRTNHGFAVEPQTSMLRQHVKSIGIGLTDRIDGPYNLEIHRIWATNGLSEEEIKEEKAICGENALAVDEGVRTGWGTIPLSTRENGKQEGLDSREAEVEDEKSKAKGLGALKDEWNR